MQKNRADSKGLQLGPFIHFASGAGELSVTYVWLIQFVKTQVSELHLGEFLFSMVVVVARWGGVGWGGLYPMTTLCEMWNASVYILAFVGSLSLWIS